MLKKISNQCLRSTLLCFSVSLSMPVLAHGWVTSPASRQDHCAAGRTAFDCGQVKYEPQSVEAPKGSRLCSGGSRFDILDSDGPWPVTNVGSTVSFTWKNTAAHRTLNWEYFLGNYLIKSFDGGNQIPPNEVSHTISGLPAGHHTILAVWNIADTAMAFYSCIDVHVAN